MSLAVFSSICQINLIRIVQDSADSEAQTSAEYTEALNASKAAASFVAAQ